MRPSCAVGRTRICSVRIEPCVTLVSIGPSSNVVTQDWLVPKRCYSGATGCGKALRGNPRHIGRPESPKADSGRPLTNVNFIRRNSLKTWRNPRG